MPGDVGWYAAQIAPLIESRDTDNRASVARLLEYAKLKDEIVNRSTLQNAIMTVDIAAVGTLGGFIFDRRVTPLLLLLLIPLSTALGLWWLNHAQTIDRIGEYIREHLWPHIVKWPEADDSPKSFEETVPHTSRIERATLNVPFAFVFIAPSLISIVAVVNLHAVRNAAWIIWGSDLLIAIFLLANWLIYAIPSLGERKPQRDPRP